MKKIIVFLLVTLSLAKGFTQNISINATGALPHASAILDVSAANKGILLPRTSTISRLAIANPAKGLILYDSTVAAFYFYNGTAWAQLLESANGWSLTGNSGINAIDNFIGTTDAQPLRFRINNINAGVIDSALSNTALGFRALDSVTTGNVNTAIGYKALTSNSTGIYNTAIGSNTLRRNTTGIYNVATGVQALTQNTTGNYNVANGTWALLNNTTGTANIAIGQSALVYNTTGENNTVSGFNALSNNFTGSNNTVMGFEALKLSNAGSHNVAIGDSAAFSQAISVGSNTAIGSHALVNNSTGYGNTAIGNNAIIYNIGGNKNIAIGDASGTFPGSPYVNNTISIGNDDILNAYQNQVFIGNTSTGFIGGQVTWSTYSDARIKNTITEDVKGLDFIMKLRPVTYHINQKAITALTGNKNTPDFPGKYDNEKIKYTGFLAQEVEQAGKASHFDFSGCAAPKNQWGLYTLSYEQFVVPLVKAMQEQQVIITNQQKQIDILEKRLTVLEAKL
ncbi:MAG: tail fiber domain-containing protein [Ginsengibacter sp.]